MGISRFELELMITTAIMIFLNLFVSSIGADEWINRIFIVWIVALIVEYMTPNSLDTI